MNFVDLENVWQSPYNHPSAAQIEKEKHRFVAELKHRHRRFVGFCVTILIVLLVITGAFILELISPDVGNDPIDLVREWSLVPLFLLPWIGWGLMVWLYRRHRIRHPDYGSSIRATVRAMLDENSVERARTKLVAGLIAGLLVIIPLIVHQLQAVGKAGDEIVFPAFVLLPMLEVSILLALTFRYRRKLLPRRRQLESLLQAYDSAPALSVEGPLE